MQIFTQETDKYVLFLKFQFSIVIQTAYIKYSLLLSLDLFWQVYHEY